MPRKNRSKSREEGSDRAQPGSDFISQLRAAKDRPRLVQLRKDQIKEVARLLQACADYSNPRKTAHVPSRAPKSSDAEMTKETNKEFCEAWVRKCWIPSIEPLRQAVSIKRAVAFRPITVINDEHAEVLEVALSAVHRLYIRLLKNSKVEKAIVRDLVVLRSELGPLRFSLCRYFAQLAGSVEGLAKEDEHQGLPLLPKDAQVFRDILVAAGPHEPILGPKLCDEYLKRTNEAVDESAFRTRIAPVLEAWGMRNQPRIGYYFPESAAARRRR